MIDKSNKNLSIKKQCQLLNISRSAYYYKPKKDKKSEFFIRKAVLEIHMAYAFYGIRRIKVQLEKEFNVKVNRKKVGKIMKELGIKTLYPKKKLNFSEKNKEHKVYPYALRGKQITRANQVWSTDITYIKLKRGMAYLVAVIDWKTRKILSWQISNSIDKELCISTVEEAINQYGKPEIFNSEQGFQFTSKAFIEMLKSRGIQISMDGKGRALDNVFIERFWRSIKYENIYLNDYSDMRELKKGVSEYIKYYNEQRYHQSLQNLPEYVYSLETTGKKGGANLNKRKIL